MSTARPGPDAEAAPKSGGSPTRQRPSRSRSAPRSLEVAPSPGPGHSPRPADAGDHAQFIEAVRIDLGASRKLFARMIGVREGMVARWEAGGAIDADSLRRAEQLRRLGELLGEGMRPEAIAQWLEAPSAGLGGSPIDALERGEFERLWRAAQLIGSGMPT